MQNKYRLYRCGSGTYYAQDRETGARVSLGTKRKAEADNLLRAKNEASLQPAFNRQMAKVYLHAQDPHFCNLRILHNRAIDLGWLLHPALSRKAWPKIKYRKRRAITPERHVHAAQTAQCFLGVLRLGHAELRAMNLPGGQFLRTLLGKLSRALRTGEMLAVALGADVPRNRVTKTVAVLKGVDLDVFRTGLNNRNFLIRFSALRASFGQTVCHHFVPSVTDLRQVVD